jgi:HD-like signal output (HDOD) protein
MDAGQLWKHSLGDAFGARIIANRKNPALANDAFTSGLLHDSGKLILDPYVLERKEAFQKLVDEGQDSFLEAEKKLLQFDHAEIAYDVCNAWRLPSSLTKAIRYHHTPSKSGGDELSNIVHMADGISLMAGLGLGIDGMMYQFDDEAMAQVGLQEDEMSHIMEEVLDAVEKLSTQVLPDGT